VIGASLLAIASALRDTLGTMTVKMESFESFRARSLRAGADEVLERRYSPGQIVDTHSHEFDAQALVSEGELWLTFGPETQHLRAGDTFHVPLGAPHSERYGPQGATYWVARRNRR